MAIAFYKELILTESAASFATFFKQAWQSHMLRHVHWIIECPTWLPLGLPTYDFEQEKFSVSMENAANKLLDRVVIVRLSQMRRNGQWAVLCFKGKDPMLLTMSTSELVKIHGPCLQDGSFDSVSFELPLKHFWGVMVLLNLEYIRDWMAFYRHSRKHSMEIEVLED